MKALILLPMLFVVGCGPPRWSEIICDGKVDTLSIQWKEHDRVRGLRLDGSRVSYNDCDRLVVRALGEVTDR